MAAPHLSNVSHPPSDVTILDIHVSRFAGTNLESTDVLFFSEGDISRLSWPYDDAAGGGVVIFKFRKLRGVYIVE